MYGIPLFGLNCKNNANVYLVFNDVFIDSGYIEKGPQSYKK